MGWYRTCAAGGAVGPGGSGFADQDVETVIAGAVDFDVTFNVTATSPIPIILYTSWAAGAYIDVTTISTTGFTVIFPVECPPGGGEFGWAYVEA